MLFAACTGFSQIMHSAGVTLSGLVGKVTTPRSTADFSMVMTTLTYSPRYNFIQGINSSVSIGTPVGVGFGITRNTYGSDAGFAFAYDLPVTLDYNIGCMATPKSNRNFGGFAGIGYGYYKVSISGSAYSNFSGATYGPMARLGLRFGSDNRDEKISVAFFYKKGMEAAKMKTFGISVLYDFLIKKISKKQK
jgi:hypothetical protein